MPNRTSALASRGAQPLGTPSNRDLWRRGPLCSHDTMPFCNTTLSTILMSQRAPRLRPSLSDASSGSDLCRAEGPTQPCFRGERKARRISETRMCQRHRCTAYMELHLCEEATDRWRAHPVRIVSYDPLVISTAGLSEKRPPPGHRGSRTAKDPV